MCPTSYPQTFSPAVDLEIDGLGVGPGASRHPQTLSAGLPNDNKTGYEPHDETTGDEPFEINMLRALRTGLAAR